TVPRRGRVQGASGERAFQDLYRRPSPAAARQARTRALRTAVGNATLFRATLEPRKIRKSESAAVNMHATKLGAAMQGREHFAGIEQAQGIKRAFQPLLLVKIDLAEHLAHQVALLDADAMFAGQDAAELDARP